MHLRILFVLSLLVVWEVGMLVRMHVWVCKEVHVQSSSSEHVQSPAYTWITKLYAARVQSAQSCMQHACAAKLYAASVRGTQCLCRAQSPAEKGRVLS